MTWWYDDMMIWWYGDMMIWWYDDMVIWWYDGMMTWWHDDMMIWDMVVWWYGDMMIWWYDDMMTWWYDDIMMIWWCDDMMIWNGDWPDSAPDFIFFLRISIFEFQLRGFIFFSLRFSIFDLRELKKRFWKLRRVMQSVMQSTLTSNNVTVLQCTLTCNNADSCGSVAAVCDVARVVTAIDSQCPTHLTTFKICKTASNDFVLS